MTELGRKLWEARAKIISSGIPMLEQEKGEMMTEQTVRNFNAPEGNQHYEYNLGSRILVHKVDGVEMFLPVSKDQIYEATLESGRKVRGSYDYVLAAIRLGLAEDAHPMPQRGFVKWEPE